MSNALQRGKSVEEQQLVHVSTRILDTSRTASCASCGSEIKLDQRHKYVSIIQVEADADESFEEAVLCDADCVSNFVTSQGGYSNP
ncbi:DUF7576 family protein [Haladaptatus halobius]|uniref:DUF7576 family protein n=1 Tax=Haladaptatus halobius TaxID=2884875 RepID=UPI003F64544B